MANRDKLFSDLKTKLNSRSKFNMNPRNIRMMTSMADYPSGRKQNDSLHGKRTEQSKRCNSLDSTRNSQDNSMYLDPAEPYAETPLEHNPGNGEKRINI